MCKTMLLLALIAIFLVNVEAGKEKRYATGAYSSAGGAASSSAGGFAGGYAGGFAGDYGTGGFVGSGFDYAPQFGAGFIDPYEFHQRLTSQILAQHAAQQRAFTSSYTTGDASFYAEASLYPDDIYHKQQQAYFDTIRKQNNYSNKGYKSNRYAPSYAAASASIGPGGSHQTAYVSPKNPAVPNVNNRFSGSSSPGGYKGVSVSSFSSSSDVNGKRTSYRGAQTTVNDNGKITSYKVHS